MWYHYDAQHNFIWTTGLLKNDHSFYRIAFFFIRARVKQQTYVCMIFFILDKKNRSSVIIIIFEHTPCFFKFSNPLAPLLTSNPGSALDLYHDARCTWDIFKATRAPWTLMILIHNFIVHLIGHSFRSFICVSYQVSFRTLQIFSHCG